MNIKWNLFLSDLIYSFLAIIYALESGISVWLVLAGKTTIFNTNYEIENIFSVLSLFCLPFALTTVFYSFVLLPVFNDGDICDFFANFFNYIKITYNSLVI